MENSTSILGSDIANKLSELGPAFNTNPGFGLDGVIKGNEMKALAAEGANTVVPAETKTVDTALDDKVFKEVIDPLNTSIQAIKQETRTQFGQIANAINELKSGQRTVETAEEIDPTTSEMRNMRNEMSQLRLNNAYSRATNTLNAFKAKHPDFDWSEQNIQQLWQERIGNNIDLAERTDWNDYFKMNYDAKRATMQDKEIETLRGKLASIESRRNSVNDLSVTPRSTNSISTAQPYADSDFNEELYQRATARMGKGKFMGWNGVLQEEQRKMQLAGKI